MKFEAGKCNKRLIGTGRQGIIHSTYEELVRIFGEPDKVYAPDKSQVIWVIIYRDGTVVSIYDYDAEGLTPEEYTDWHVGGHNPLALQRVRETIERATVDGEPVDPDPDILRLGVYGITIEGCEITSDLQEEGSPLYNCMIDGIESLILAHHCAGVDITTPDYKMGIETAVDAINNAKV